MARRCVFCGAETPLTKEHVFPLWISKAANLAAGEIFIHDLDGNKRNNRSIDVQVRAVCGSCNNGWMAELEGEARAILLPLIRGEQMLLSANNLDTLALWAIKTAIMVAHLSKVHKAMITPAMTDSIFLRRTPPPCIRVWIAFEHGGADSDVALKSIPMLYRAELSSRGVAHIFYDWTVTIGSLVLRTDIFPEDMWQHEGAMAMTGPEEWVLVSPRTEAGPVAFPPIRGVRVR